MKIEQIDINSLFPSARDLINGTPIKIEQIGINILIPSAHNAKLYSASQINAVASSIEEFGFKNPVFINDDYHIIAGHCRVLAAQRLNLSIIPCIRLNHLNENGEKAYLIADDKLTETGDSWDLEMIQLELESEMLRLEQESIEFNKFQKFQNFNLK